MDDRTVSGGAPPDPSAEEAPAFDLASFKNPVPKFDEEEPAPRISLGPLSLLGFGAPSGRRSYPGGSPASSNGLVTAAALVVVIAALKIGRPVLLPMIVSALLAVLTAPFVLYLKSKKVPAHFGVPLVVLAAVFGLAALASVVVANLNAFTEAAPSYQERATELLHTASTNLAAWGFPTTVKKLSALAHSGVAMEFAAAAVSEVADMLSNTFLVLLMTIFLLFEALIIPDKIRRALRDPHADLSQGIQVVGRIQAYVVIKTTLSLITGVIIGVTLHLLGVDFAILWGLIAFLCNFVPNIGSIVAAVPAILMAILQGGTTLALSTAAAFVGVNVVLDSFVEPKIMGERMDLSPLVVFVCLLFWGWLWGPVGMLLSVPLTMTIRILLEGNEQTRAFAILMAGAPRAPIADRKSAAPKAT